MRPVHKGVEVVEQKLAGKFPPVPDDVLSPQREELVAYEGALAALKFESGLFTKFMNASGEMQPARLHTALNLVKANNELDVAAAKYAEAYVALGTDRQDVHTKAEQLAFELTNREALIQNVRKKLDKRDKAYKLMQDQHAVCERFKLKEDNNKGKSSSAPSAPPADPAAEQPARAATNEAEQKLTQLEEEFNVLTQECADELNHLLTQRNKFLNDRMADLIDLQVVFFTKGSVALGTLTGNISALRS